MKIQYIQNSAFVCAHKFCNPKHGFVKLAVRRKCEYILHLNVRLLN